MSTYPRMVLDRDLLDHNIATMAAWCRDHEVELAPHIKTTMCRPVVERQIGAGAHSVTVATVAQALLAHQWGARSVIIANEVVMGSDLRELRRILEADPGWEVCCFVDSAAGIAAAQRVFAHAAPALSVLIDIGTPNGRTGVRTALTAELLATEVTRAPGLRLCGVAGYEGVVPSSRDPLTRMAVDRHVGEAARVFVALADRYETQRPLFTMGGSVFVDRVVAHRPQARAVPGARIMVRAGCYVTHDHGVYADTSPIPGLRAAVTVQAAVLSTPQRRMAVLGAGRRELPEDSGLPTILGARSESGQQVRQAAGVVAKLFDHHAVVRDMSGLEVTDVVTLGISHPCSVFSRWAQFDVSAGGVVVDRWRTDLLAASSKD